jgi:hypothetical protein
MQRIAPRIHVLLASQASAGLAIRRKRWQRYFGTAALMNSSGGNGLKGIATETRSPQVATDNVR